MQVMAADHDLVAVGERAPLDALAVDEHAVEAAIVEHAQPVGLTHDQRVPTGDGRIVEADVGREAAADPRPLALQGERRPDPVVAGAVGEVLPGLVERSRSSSSQTLILDVGRDVDDARLGGREQRSADELLAPAVGAGGKLVDGVERHRIVTIGATKGSGPRDVARHPSFHGRNLLVRAAEIPSRLTRLIMIARTSKIT